MSDSILSKAGKYSFSGRMTILARDNAPDPVVRSQRLVPERWMDGTATSRISGYNLNTYIRFGIPWIFAHAASMLRNSIIIDISDADRQVLMGVVAVRNRHQNMSGGRKSSC